MVAIARPLDPPTLGRVGAEVAARALAARFGWVVQTQVRPTVSGSAGLDPPAGAANPHAGGLLGPDERHLSLTEVDGALIGLHGQSFRAVLAERLGSKYGGFVIVMDREDQAPFDDDDRALLRGLSAQLGAALDAAHEREDANTTRTLHRALIEQLPAVTYYRAVDTPGVPSFISPQIEALLGFPASAFIEDPGLFRSRMHPDDRRELERPESTFKPGQIDGPARAEYRLLHRDGSIRWVHNHALRVEDEHGAELVVGVIVDTTEQRQTADAQRATEARLLAELRERQKLEAVGRLAGGIAHDFNNLLGVILGYAAMARDRTEAVDPRHGFLHKVIDAGERASQLTSQMLSIGRRQLVEPRLVDLAELVRDMSNLLRSLCGEGLTFEATVSAAPLVTRIDFGQLQQVVLNLISNARDASHAGGAVRVEVRARELSAVEAGELGVAPGAFVELCVRDEGHGMDEETNRRIFEPFFTTKAPGRGTGLGLAMARSIANEAGGTIVATSAPDKGSSFSVLLPRHAVGEGQVCADAAQAKVSSGVRERVDRGARASLTVLVVEDEASLRRLVVRVLARAGHSLLEAGTAEEALDLFERGERFDLLLTDVVMPGLNGRQLFEGLCQRGYLGPVLFMTGYTDDDVVVRGLRESALTVLRKPFTATSLTEAVALAAQVDAASSATG